MLNQIVLVGRIESFKDIEKGIELILKIPRVLDREKEDFIPIIIKEGIAVNVKQYCNPGDVVGVKGSIYNEDGIKIIAEKLTFLASTKKPDDVLNEKDGK